MIGVGDLRRNVALADSLHVFGGNIQRSDDGIENRVYAAHNLRIRATELVVPPAFGQLPGVRSFGQSRQFFLQPLQDGGDVVDGLLHLFVVALVGLGNQLVDFSVGNLRQDAIAFAYRQQDGIQHGVHAAHNLGVSALELFRLSAIGELPFLRSFRQTHQFLLQTLQHDGDVVDGLLHLFVVALVSLGNQFVDLSVRDLRQDAIAFADRQQNGIQHGVHAAHNLGVSSLELFRLSAIGQLPFLRSSVRRTNSFCRPCSTVATLLMACFIFS